MAIFRFSNAGGFGTYQRYNDFLAGNPTTPIITDNGSMFPLGVFTLSSAQANVEFTNIPQTYTHLQLRFLYTDTANTQAVLTLRVGNGTIDTGNNYARHLLGGTGSASYAGGAGSLSSIGLSYASGNTSVIFGAGVIDVLDYRNANKFKTVRAFYGNDLNGSGYIQLASGLWQSTSAINTIRFTTEGNIAANSSFALYGIK